MPDDQLTEQVTTFLLGMPRWAKAAFCARAARRIFPLYRDLNVRAPEHLIAIERAISLAEERASKGNDDCERDPYDQQALAETLHAIVEAALNTQADASGGEPDDPFFVEASAYAASAQAAQAAYIVAFKDDLSTTVPLDAAALALLCAEVAVAASPAFTHVISLALIADLQHLSSHLKTLTASDSTPIPPSVFGPMWPLGAPAGWPADKHFFKPRARLMLLLGDELIKDAGIAVFELVKNAYDADASECHVLLKRIDVDTADAKIVVRDNGCGMTLETIVSTWLEPGTDNRRSQRETKTRTSVYHRQPLGEKGVGRFAVHKLGHRIELVTRAVGCDEVVVSIDWRDFARSEYISDVPVTISTRTPTAFVGDQTGTLITVTALRDAPWTRRRIRDLHRAVTSICSPFKGPESFVPTMQIETVSSENWLEGLLTASEVAEQAPFRFHALIDGDTLDYEYTFTPIGNLDRVDARESKKRMPLRAPDRRRADALLSLPADSIGPVYLQVFIFDRTPQILKLTATDVRGVRDYLDENGGVRVFRDGVRVFDFGEPGNDWLNLGGSRVNDPSARLGNNQVIGAVLLSQSTPTSSRLIEKTNREGFVENEAFQAFREAVQFCLQQAAAERNIDKERIRIAYAVTKNKAPVIDDLAELRAALDKRALLAELGPIVDRIEAQYRQVTDRLLVAAGAGLNLSVIMHEVEKGIHGLRHAIGDSAENTFLLAQAKQLSDMVDSLAWLTRRSDLGEVSLVSLVSHAIRVWGVRFSHHAIGVQNACSEDYTIRGYKRLLLSASMNLIDNAIYWLRSRAADRKLYVGVTNQLGGRPAIVVADNGPGFLDSPEYLTEPFFTRKPDGMGLGLYIAQEVMHQHKGTLEFPQTGDLAIPAEFTGAVVALRFKGAL